MSRNLEALTLLDPSGPAWPVMGELYLLFNILHHLSASTLRLKSNFVDKGILFYSVKNTLSSSISQVLVKRNSQSSNLTYHIAVRRLSVDCSSTGKTRNSGQLT
jgi:hypothetical protein